MSFKKELLDENGRITINKFDDKYFNNFDKEYTSENIKNICFLDLETTGLSKEDKIVEIAIKLVEIEKESGILLRVIDFYESFNDPGFKMDSKNIAIHGITDAMVSKQSIDWNKVKDIFEKSDIIVAHNARFDRSFMDIYFPLSEEKLWACSMNDIDWISLGFNSRKQEMLCIWHGFYYESHRAMSDVDALIHLVTHPTYKDQKPIRELIGNARQIGYKILALNSPYERKDTLKSNGYFWDDSKKCWWKVIKEEVLENEKSWLESNIYSGSFMGQVELVMPSDRYK